MPKVFDEFDENPHLVATIAMIFLGVCLWPKLFFANIRRPDQAPVTYKFF